MPRKVIIRRSYDMHTTAVIEKEQIDRDSSRLREFTPKMAEYGVHLNTIEKVGVEDTVGGIRPRTVLVVEAVVDGADKSIDRWVDDMTKVGMFTAELSDSAVIRKQYDRKKADK